MHQFLQLTTPASPGQVWAALTSPELTPRYLYGLAATSTWHAGAPVAFDLPGVTALAGEVLAAAEPHRLSYSMQAGEGQPSTYVTWEVSSAGEGSVVRLSVDEPDDLTAEGPAPEAAAAWARVMEALAGMWAVTRLADEGTPHFRGPGS